MAGQAQGATPTITQPAGPNVFGQASGALGSAISAAQGGAGFQPMFVGGMGYAPSAVSGAPAVTAQNVSGRGYNAAIAAGAPAVTAQNVAAGQLAGMSLSPYMNPYESQVVGQSLSDLNRAREMAMGNVGAQATAARAFGGTRQALMEAETNRAFAEQAARTASGLRQTGFERALQYGQFDIGTAMQAALANQQANLAAGTTTAGNVLQAQLANQAAQNVAGQFGASAANQAALANQQASLAAGTTTAGNILQAQLANQAAQNVAGQFGASAANQAALANQQAALAANQQRMGAAGTLGNLASTAFGMGRDIQSQQMQQGAMQQALQQQLIDAARGQYGGFTSAPAQSLSLPLAALGVAPKPETRTETRNLGLFDYITALAQMPPRMFGL